METKVISVRIDKRDLEKLDQAVESLSYKNRNDLICAAIRLVVWMHGRHQAFNKICSFFPRWGDIVDKFEFEFHRETNRRE